MSAGTTAVPVAGRTGRPDEEVVLAVEQLSVAYGSGAHRVDAVRAVDLELRRGETVAVVGESGSGKSTTAHALLGLLPPSASITGGRATFDGMDLIALPDRRLRRIRGRHIGFIPQDPMVALNPVQRVGDQVAEVLRIHGLADRRAARIEAVAALELAGLDRPEVRARQYPHELSGGMRQRALIAIALVSRPSVLVADEPTSALDVTVQRVILDRIGELGAELGAAVLLITHDLGVAAERADRLVVMKDGQVVETGPAADVAHRPQHDYTRALMRDAPGLTSRRLINDRPPAAPERTGPATDGPGTAPFLEVDRVTKEFDLPGARREPAFRAVDAVSFTVGPGETYGLVGESGSGKSTTARLAVRLADPTSGRIMINGADVTTLRGERLRRLRRRVQIVYQNPYASLDPRLTVGASIAEPLDAFGIGSRADRRRQAADLLERVALPAATAARRPAELSGGQRQRVAIARALALRPGLIVCDEPVSALDVSVQARILELLVSLQAELGVSYVFISHDLAVVRQIAHRVGVMHHGVLVEQGPTEQVFAAPTSEHTRHLLAAIPGSPRADHLDDQGATHV